MSIIFKHAHCKCPLISFNNIDPITIFSQLTFNSICWLSSNFIVTKINDFEVKV